jgi:heat shock protein HslJ
MQWLSALAGAIAFAASAAALTVPDLTGPEWTLTAINGVAPTGDRPPTIFFSRDREAALGAVRTVVNGFSGCNRYVGSYGLNERGHIRIEIRGMTKMACDGPRMELERNFLAALGAMANFELRQDRTMSMTSGDGTTRLDFKQEAPKPAN